ncbi:MAG: response regulator [Candidatus Omnitrophica bacterium]|nr:response regulator [Candidatus Omnitrophota bacterium]
MNKKILIIDDNAQDRKIVVRYLNGLGFGNILQAERGDSGVEKAKAERPDWIIVDTVLPDIDGFEVCRRIKDDDALKNSKVIIMTGSVDSVDAVKAKRNGADDYCVKSPDCASLLEVIADIQGGGQ